MLEDLKKRLLSRPLNPKMAKTLPEDIASVKRLMNGGTHQPPDIPHESHTMVREEILSTLQVPSPTPMPSPTPPHRPKVARRSVESKAQRQSEMLKIITTRDQVHGGSWITYLGSILDTETQDGLGSTLKGLLSELHAFETIASEFYIQQHQNSLNALLNNPKQPALSKEMLALIGALSQKEQLKNELTTLRYALGNIWNGLRHKILYDDQHKMFINSIIEQFSASFETIISRLLRICEMQTGGQVREIA